MNGEQKKTIMMNELDQCILRGERMIMPFYLKILILLFCIISLSGNAIAGNDDGIEAKSLNSSYEDAQVTPYDHDLLHKYLKNEQYENAIELLLPSAEAGYAREQQKIGELYKALPNPDYQKALNWIQMSVTQDYAPAKVSLANMYLAGQGVEKDQKRAVQLLLDAESQGNENAKTLLNAARKNGWWGLPLESK